MNFLNIVNDLLTRHNLLRMQNPADWWMKSHSLHQLWNCIWSYQVLAASLLVFINWNMFCIVKLFFQANSMKLTPTSALLCKASRDSLACWVALSLHLSTLCTTSLSYEVGRIITTIFRLWYINFSKVLRTLLKFSYKNVCESIIFQ